MTSDQFAYWLQGFFEMTDTKVLSEKQVTMVKEHLKLVFNKITPNLEHLPQLNPEERKKEAESLKKQLEAQTREIKRWSSTRSPKLC